MSVGEQFPVFAAVALVGGDEADRAVAMLGVVPSGEAVDPGPRCFDRREAPGRLGGCVLAGPEQRLGEWIIIRHPGPAERRGLAESLHRDLHRGTLHRAAVVGMKNERAAQAPLGPDRALQDLRGELGRFAVVDLPADDLAAENVDDEVEVEERAGDRPRQPRYIPAPDLARRLRLEAGGQLAACNRAGAASAMVLAAFAQDPLGAGIRGDLDALVRQPRHDLAGWQAGKFGRIAGCHDQVALLFAQFVCGLGTLGEGAAIVADCTQRPRPALQGACVQADFGTGGGPTRACRHGPVDQGNNLLAIRG